MRKYLRLLAATSVLLGCSTGTALADVITFDALDPAYGVLAPSLPFIGHGDFLVEDGYAIGMASTKAGALAGDLVGAVLDGADPSSCFSVVCPGNDATRYLAALNDGLPFVFRVDGGLLNLTQFDASFIAAQGADVLPTAMLLRLAGFVGGTVIFEDVFLPGPVSGDYDFTTYTVSAAFAHTAFEEIDFIGYACTTPTTCTRALNQAQFGLDNITVTAAVPEPATWALLCAGFIGVGIMRRRRAMPA